MVLYLLQYGSLVEVNSPSSYIGGIYSYPDGVIQDHPVFAKLSNNCKHVIYEDGEHWQDGYIWIEMSKTEDDEILRMR